MSLVVDGLAVARLARLVVKDGIALGLRRRIVSAVEAGHLPGMAEELIGCEWCVALWAAGLALSARALAPRAWRAASAVLAVSEVAGLLEELR